MLEDLRHFGLDLCFGPVGVLLSQPGGLEPAGRPVQAHRKLKLLGGRHFLEHFDLYVILTHARNCRSAARGQLYTPPTGLQMARRLKCVVCAGWCDVYTVRQNESDERNVRVSGTG